MVRMKRPMHDQRWNKKAYVTRHHDNPKTTVTHDSIIGDLYKAGMTEEEEEEEERRMKVGWVGLLLSWWFFLFFGVNVGMCLFAFFSGCS